MHAAQKKIIFNVTARHGRPLPKLTLGLNNSASIRAVTNRVEPWARNQCIWEPWIDSSYFESYPEMFGLPKLVKIIFGLGKIGQVKNWFFHLNSSHGWSLMHAAQKKIFFNVTARHGWPLPKLTLGLNNSTSIRAVTNRVEPWPRNQCI